MRPGNLILLLIIFTIQSCAQETKNKPAKTMTDTNSKTLDSAVVGGGCFWCTEAQYLLLDGVVSVASGYSGGTVKNPSYKEVCTGNTGHAEVIKVVYDTTKLNYADILQAFFASHDPTQLNRQGNDIGTQYRSVIFYANDEQKKIAEQIKSELDKSGAYKDPVVTEISPLKEFYVAENYHQNYFNQNGNEPYCQFVVAPKVEKFKKVFKSKLKKSE